MQGVKFEGRLVREEGDAPAAAEVDGPQSRARGVDDAAGDVERVPVLSEKHRVVQHLRAGVDVKAGQFERGGGLDAGEHCGELHFVDPERGGAASHPHAAPLNGGVGIDSDGDAGDAIQFGGEARETFDFVGRFDVQLADAAFEGRPQFGVGLAGTGEDDAFRGAAGGAGEGQLASGCDFETAAPFEQMPQDGERRVGLHRVVKAHAIGEAAADDVAGGVEDALRIREDGGSVAVRQLADRNVLDEQFAMTDGEVGFDEGADERRGVGGGVRR